MSRLVELEESEPTKLGPSDLDPDKGDVAICQCGLSEEFPFCDGSHRATRTETEGICYRYLESDDDTVRQEVARVTYTAGESEEFEEELD
jgi:CDGSH-type Zn-finger protein